MNSIFNDCLFSTDYRRIPKGDRKEPVVNEVKHAPVEPDKPAEILLQTAENIPETNFYFYLTMLAVIGFFVCFLVFLRTSRKRR